MSNRRILLTGGSGFIGSNLLNLLSKEVNFEIGMIDSETELFFEQNRLELQKNITFEFYKGDICNKLFINDVINDFKPDIIFHLAAESHVDNSISNPSIFLNTNIIGTYNLIECFTNFGKKENSLEDKVFFHVSTDEVFGYLDIESSKKFTEKSTYQPSSPYSASKASSDLLVRSYTHTFGLPHIITNCSNNYGPNQHHEKFIPTIINSIIKGKEIPIYGDGRNVRDWLFVEDHTEALLKILNSGKINTTFLIGGQNEVSNISLVGIIIELFKNISKEYQYSADLIRHVSDRLGHDLRYAICIKKIKSEIGWYPTTKFEDGLMKTINFYLEKQ
jgi:dTDP-glucose 4,6-dehydratase